MATVATRLIAFLKAQSTVTSYVQGRIAETEQPQGKPVPYIVLTRIGSENADCLSDSAGGGPLSYSVEVGCVAEKEADANAVGDAVRAVLHCYRGAFDDTTAKGCFVDSETLDFTPYSDGSNEGKFTRRLETRIFL